MGAGVSANTPTNSRSSFRKKPVPPPIAYPTDANQSTKEPQAPENLGGNQRYAHQFDWHTPPPALSNDEGPFASPPKKSTASGNPLVDALGLDSPSRDTGRRQCERTTASGESSIDEGMALADIEYQLSDIGGYKDGRTTAPSQQPGSAPGRGSPSDQVSGIGALIERYHGHLVVRHMLPGGPASRCPLIRVGSCIRFIDGEAVSTMPFAQVLRMLRGSPGSSVTLSLSRNLVSAKQQEALGSVDSDSLVTVTLVRDFCAPVSELDPLPSINPLDFVGLKGDDTPWGVGNSSVSRPPRA